MTEEEGYVRYGGVRTLSQYSFCSGTASSGTLAC